MDFPESQNEEEQIKSLEEVLLGQEFLKPVYTQQTLIKLREQYILDRAYMVLDFKPEKINEAIAASAYSLAKLQLMDLLINNGRIIDVE